MAMARQPQIALLRGINLGARRRVAMADLRDLIETDGHSDVRTLLQSGNAVFVPATPPAQTASSLERAIARELGFEVRVLIRTRSELGKVVAANPLGDVATDPKKLIVTFLSAKPRKAALSDVDRADYEPERFELRGREIYSWHPGGTQPSKLTKNFADERLGVTTTARNWNTVTKLLELAKD